MIIIKKRATIETKPFTIDFGNNPDAEKIYRKEHNQEMPDKSDDVVNRQSEDLAKYPVVYLNGVIIESTQIKNLILNNDSFVPSLSLEFSDSTGKLIDDNFPVDNSIISIFKESSNKNLMAIKMDFKITDFSIVKGTNAETLSYMIDAILDINELYYNDFESYKGTSFNVLQTISNKIGLGFATNIDGTNDEMIWINPSNYKIEFLKEIVGRSYINDETFLFGYIDFYYNFNYVDIESQLNEDISTQMNMLDRETLIKDGQDDQVPLILSNKKDCDGTNMFISKYTIINSSTNINLKYGYRHMAFYYNKTEDNYKKYMLDNITVDDNSIVMKGNPDDVNGLYDNMINNSYMGKMDNDNVHKEYLHTILQNRNNLKFLQKIKMTIRLSKVNYGLYRFQKVLVELYNNGKLSDNKETKLTPTDIENGENEYDVNIIHKLSGEWLITAINLTYSKTEGNIQELTLVKRELTDIYTFPRRIKKK